MLKAFLIFLLFTSMVHSSNTYDAREDLLDVIDNAFDASLYQFDSAESQVALWMTLPLMGQSFQEDERLTKRYGKNKKSGFMDGLGTLGVVSNFNVVPLTFYVIGRQQNNSKTVMFAKDVVSSWLLASVETVLISLIRVHKRPDDNEAGFFETAFRGDSSFPSGHAIPSMVLAMQTHYYYGWAWSLLPWTAAALISYQRVESQKHYFSDITGALLLSLWASSGVHELRKKNQGKAQMAWFPIIGDEDRLGLSFAWRF